MALWNGVKEEPVDPSADPETGTVKDNRDGQYEISYRLTRAGVYRMELQVCQESRQIHVRRESEPFFPHILGWIPASYPNTDQSCCSHLSLFSLRLRVLLRPTRHT